MKKTILTLMLSCVALVTNAQEYLCIDTYWDGAAIVPVELIDGITFSETTIDNLPELMAKDDNIKLFCEALQLTGLCDSLTAIYDHNFYYEQELVVGIHGILQALALQKLRKGYTAFVETDETYALHGIYSIEDLKAYAAKVYDEMYPEDANVTDPTDRRNSLNRFVAYHLLDRRGTKSNLTVAGIKNDRAGDVALKYRRNMVDIADWYETMMPHSLLKCSSPLLGGEETVFINRRGLQDHADDRGVLVEGAQIVNEAGYDYQGAALNGFYHYVSDIIAYDRQTQEVVLDEQIIVNNSTISPEFMNNNLRLEFSHNYSPDGEIFIPNGALKNVQVNDERTRMFYLFNKSWHNAQTDEMMLMGAYDIAIKLPPVPAGTYELNMGYTANELRGVAVAYLDEEFIDTVNLRKLALELGWISDDMLNSPEAIAENDSLLFNQGYRKGLPYFFTDRAHETHRDNSLCLRRILTTFTTDGKSDHYLRIKNVDIYDASWQQFQIDYLELCPTHLLPEYE